MSSNPPPDPSSQDAPTGQPEPAALELGYRTWFKGGPPRRIKLAIPGWSGSSSAHGDGSPAQPWHCQPFVDGSTYGLELVYPFDTECRVWRDDEGLHFDGDFTAELAGAAPEQPSPGHPFVSFATHHYGFTSSLDILPPPGYALRIEPHPRFFTDFSGEVPVAVPGHIQRFWPRIFFVVFKAPPPGATHVFRRGEPYAQLLVVPSTASYRLTPMEEAGAESRGRQDRQIGSLTWLLAKHIWRSSAGYWFDDKYKQLIRVYRAGGLDGVRDFLQRLDDRAGGRAGAQNG